MVSPHGAIAGEEMYLNLENYHLYLRHFFFMIAGMVFTTKPVVDFVKSLGLK